MKVLVGCEYTGTVRDAFTRAGHYAMSCDLDPTESPGPHYRGDIMQLLDSGHKWDLVILHPDCTYMALCGNGTYQPKGIETKERRDAIEWTVALWYKALKYSRRVCLENPKSVIFPVLRDWGARVQYVKPEHFGHPETKLTGLALHCLNPLVPTWDVSDIMETLPLKERHKTWYASPSDTRGKDRSRFFPGFARAMVEQWGQNND